MGWPQRGSSTFVDRDRQSRCGLIRSLGGQDPESWLNQLPAITVLPEPRAELEVGRQPGAQPDLPEALARLGRGGRLLLDSHLQGVPSELPECELQLIGSDPQPGNLDFGRQCRWRQGWLRLEHFQLRGTLQVEGGLVELKQCHWLPGSQLVLSGVGALVLAEGCDFHGTLEARRCSLLEAHHCNFEHSTLGLRVAGLALLQGVACCGHAEAALRIEERGRVRLEDCQIRECGLGLEALGRSLVWIQDCWVRENFGAAIQASEQARVEVRASHLRNNRGDGIRADGEARLSLQGCQIVQNQGCGVRLEPGVLLERTDNTLCDNQDGDWLELHA